jgi:hypothetical protein
VSERQELIMLGIGLAGFGVACWWQGFFYFRGKRIKDGRAVILASIAMTIGLIILIRTWFRG